MKSLTPCLGTESGLRNPQNVDGVARSLTKLRLRMIKSPSHVAGIY